MRTTFGIRRVEGNPAYGDKAVMWDVVETTTDSNGEFVSTDVAARVRTRKEAERRAHILNLAHAHGI